MTPRDPDFAARIATSFAQQGFLAHLGAELAEVTPGRCVIACPFRAELTQQHGVFHGGLLTTLADTAAGYAAMSLLPPGGEVLSIEFKITFLRPGAGVAAVARGEVLRPGRTITASRADVLMRQADGSEILAATMLATFMAAQPETR
ncbi:PaaI family thioesterase [Falsiroseomonas oryziterrae]|uniref:PaaI family thioesterase n=1 Tax=Falsiroseomonas oryziterrae TaxID=2911368 RepID=UPI001F3FDC7A|nr:PaaI family thioesterase [Roseomonas sp. NPKOSM-4]